MKKVGVTLALVLSLVVVVQPAAAGEAFFKGGYFFSPSSLGDAGDKWFVALGSDYDLSDVGYLGFEIQGAYRSNTVPGVASLKTIPVNALVTGKWKMDREKIRPFAGGGLGLVSAVVRTSSQTPLLASNTTYVRNAGIQLQGGAEFNDKWLAEFVGQRSFATGAQWSWGFAGGLRW